MSGTIEPPCGVPAHRMGRWVDVVLGIWFCPDCGEEIWATEGVDDERRPEGDGGGLGAARATEAAVPGVPSVAVDPGDDAGASPARAPWVGWRDGPGGARLWHLIVDAFGRAAEHDERR